MKAIASTFLLALAAGCASSGVIQTGGDTYMLTKSSAGGAFVPGSAVLGHLYIEANRFCSRQNLVVETVEGTSKNAVPFVRPLPSAVLRFKCIRKS